MGMKIDNVSRVLLERLLGIDWRIFTTPLSENSSFSSLRVNGSNQKITLKKKSECMAAASDDFKPQL
jgi:hypothetical protein